LAICRRDELQGWIRSEPCGTREWREQFHTPVIAGSAPRIRLTSVLQGLDGFRASSEAHRIAKRVIVEPLIQLRNLEKSIEAGPNKFFLLRRVSIDIQQGEFVTIMGPSGAGKSTLLSIIGMLDSAWTGEYYFLDQAVHKMNVKKRNELHKAN